jgi:starch-binding outer membrane protein, SusD/RagB family
MNTKSTDMKKISKLILCFFIASFALVGCNDMLDVNSKRLTTDKQYDLTSPGDSVYSMFGLFSRLQKLGDSYVLLGELRGDLMDVTESSDIYLREINNFDISSKNIYVNIKNYYDVINNCNYIIQKLDTAAMDQGQQLKLREYAAVKSIRAWTYMQLALNFKTVKYYTTPILTVADAEKTYAEYNLEDLADLLIADLEPIKNVPNPGLGFIDSYNSNYSYFPVHFVLGDLYLWRASLKGDDPADYEKAAFEYNDLMYKKSVIINGEKDLKDPTIPSTNSTVSYWKPVNKTISTDANLYWMKAFTLSSGEVLTTITCPTQYGQNFYLDSLNNQHKIAPSSLALHNWDNQTYYLNEASNAQGDLRKYGSISYSPATNSKVVTDYSFSGVTSDSYLIYKYKAYQQNIIIYRSSLLYLRYAEAVNRLNKPNLAFAVLKYGLNSTNMFNNKMVPAKEKTPTTLPYMSFSDPRFINNVGVRVRGLGYMDNDTTFFTIHRQATMKDSVLFVEDLIQQELALETAFEGNRFHDLMRIALRRIKNGEGDASYLAKKVAAKHTDNQSAIESKLMDVENWYIKK